MRILKPKLATLLSLLVILTYWATAPTWAEISPRGLGEESAWTRPVTVETEFVVLDDSPATGLGKSPLWLAGLTVSPHETFPALAVSVREATSWFGTVYTVYLESDRNMLRGVDGEPSAFSQYPLGSLVLAPGYRYRTRLAYDPGTGDVSVAIKNLTIGETVISKHLAWDMTAQELLVFPAGPGQVSQGGSVSLEHVAVIPAYLPVPGQWSIRQWSDTASAFVPVDRIDRRKETVALMDVLPAALPGTLQIALTPVESTAEHDAAIRWEVAERGLTPVAVAHLAAGRYRLALEYAIGDERWLLDEGVIAVGTVAAEIIDLKASETLDGVQLAGAVALESDGYIPGVRFTLDGAPIAYDVQFDSETRHVSIVKHDFQVTGSIRTDALYAGDLDGRTIVDFRLRVPLGAQAVPARMWEIQLRPRVEPAYAALPAEPYVTWVGPDMKEGAWAGFLQDDQTRSYALYPGLVVHRVRGRLPAGPISMYITEIDLTKARMVVDALLGDTFGPEPVMWPRATVSALVRAHGALAAINADFFEIQDTMAPRGLHIQSGTLLSTGSDPRATFRTLSE